MWNLIIYRYRTYRFFFDEIAMIPHDVFLRSVKDGRQSWGLRRVSFLRTRRRSDVSSATTTRSVKFAGGGKTGIGIGFTATDEFRRWGRFGSIERGLSDVADAASACRCKDISTARLGTFFEVGGRHRGRKTEESARG
jgi:hypothetical protein